MTQDQAEEIVGGADSEFLFVGTDPDRCQAYYHHTDCLGGVTSLSVLYLGPGTPIRVVDCGAEYWPFHDTPPWLARLEIQPDPNCRVRQLLHESEDLQRMAREWEAFWHIKSDGTDSSEGDRK